ncbi:hypothetical protein [Leptolyngbya ohadii]|uniref:hypothetical protein n=1 Tax=Leptolyngbya ohadii TaxID=1962290 RepID=UPI000B59D2F2|nr:hypothetical protein [Leptolyngbya ohadii]
MGPFNELELIQAATAQVAAASERSRLLTELLTELQVCAEALTQVSRLKDEFFALLSHELRSPFNPILGWTCLLRNGKLDQDRHGRNVERSDEAE